MLSKHSVLASLVLAYIQAVRKLALSFKLRDALTTIKSFSAEAYITCYGPLGLSKYGCVVLLPLSTGCDVQRHHITDGMCTAAAGSRICDPCPTSSLNLILSSLFVDGYQINSRMWRLEKIREQGGGREEAEATVEMLHARSSGDSTDLNTSDASDVEPSPADSAAAVAAAYGRGRGSSGSIISDATRAARAARASQIKPKLAARRNRMTMLRRAPLAHAEALARSNAVRSRSSDGAPCINLIQAWTAGKL